MTRLLQAVALLTAPLLLVQSADAKVVSQNATGFMVTHEADVPVAPQAAYDAFVKIGQWWSDTHSFSGAE